MSRKQASYMQQKYCQNGKYIKKSKVKYTINGIIIPVINCGLTLKQFDERPARENDKLPGEFTLIAIKG